MKTTKWTLEPMHSEVQFKVRHMMISNVTGIFTKFNAEMETEEDDFTTAKISFTADVDSISTNNEQRDKHLHTSDFFDLKSHPKIVFENGSLERITDHAYRLRGNLTIRGITKTVSFDVVYGGTIKDSWGNIRAGFTIEGKINRKEYGLHWDAVTEAGGMVVSDEVKLLGNMEFIKSVEKGQELKAKEESIPMAA